MKLIKKNKKLIALIGFLVLYFFYIWPTASGYLWKVFVPVKIPEEFYSVNRWLKMNTDDFRIIWLPPYLGDYPSWAKDKAIGDFAVFSSPRPSFYPLISPYFKNYFEWLTNSSF